QRRDEDAARAQRVAERRVLRGSRGGKPAEALERIETHERVVAEADLRAAETELEHRPDDPGQHGEPLPERGEPRDPSALVDQARDRDAYEDRGLLDRAH